MKKIIFGVLILMATMLSCTNRSESVEITVNNPLSLDRESEIVEIPISKLENKLKLEKGMSYLVINEQGDTIPSQTTYDEKLIFVGGLKASQTITFKIVSGINKEYKSHTFGRNYPERYDDFTWENDRVGFRFYGAKLKEVQAPTSGLDLWYKRTNTLILDEWYRKDLSKEASYHVDHGEGCDPYAVGQTLGGGSMAILLDSILYLNQNYTSAEVFENGPLRTTFKLTYPSMKIGDKEISETKTISLDQGSQLTKIIQEYSLDKASTVVTGFPLRTPTDSAIYTKGDDYFIYEEPSDAINEQIFLGIILPQGINQVSVQNTIYDWVKSEKIKGASNIVAETSYQPNTSITYYTGFGWTKFGFNTVSAFKEYIENYSKSLQNGFVITYN